MTGLQLKVILGILVVPFILIGLRGNQQATPLPAPVLHLAEAELQRAQDYVRLHLPIALEHPPVASEEKSYAWHYEVRFSNLTEELTKLQGVLAVDFPVAEETTAAERTELALNLALDAATVGQWLALGGVQYDVHLKLLDQATQEGAEDTLLTHTTQQGHFDLPQPVAASNLNVAHRWSSWLKLEVTTEMTFDNPNSFAVQLNGVQGDWRVLNRAWQTHPAQRQVQLAPYGQQTTSMRLMLPILELGSGIIDSLHQARHFAYAVEVSAQVATESSLLDLWGWQQSYEGSLALRERR